MNRTKIFILIFTFLFTGAIVFAQTKRQIPKGMEVIKMGGSAEIIVPKGAKTRKVGAQIIVEGTKEYVARRFEEMEERFTAIEQNQEVLRNEIKNLKGMQEIPKEEDQTRAPSPSNSIIVP